MENVTLSKESQNFIENLRVYLFSSGKKTSEIDEITQELEVHLYEAEKHNKGIEHIIGNSPKEYMEQLSQEMAFDIKGWFKYVPLFIFGAFSGLALKDAVFGTIDYSMLKLIGYPLIGIIMLLVYMFSFKYLASHKLSKTKEFLILGGVGWLSIGMFLCLILLNGQLSTPAINLGTFGNIVVATITIIFLVGISIWSKTLISIIFPILYIAPEYFVGLTSFSEATKLILSSLLMYGGMGVYLFIATRNLKKTSAN